MITAQCLARQWLELFNTNTNAPTRKKQFMAKYNANRDSYNKLSEAGKEKFTILIHKGIKSSLFPSA